MHQELEGDGHQSSHKIQTDVIHEIEIDGHFGDVKGRFRKQQQGLHPRGVGADASASRKRKLLKSSAFYL